MNAVDEIFLNLNRFYMAVLLVASMVIVMVARVEDVRQPKGDAAIVTVAALVFVVPSEHCARGHGSATSSSSGR